MKRLAVLVVLALPMVAAAQAPVPTVSCGSDESALSCFIRSASGYRALCAMSSGVAWYGDSSMLDRCVAVARTDLGPRYEAALKELGPKPTSSALLKDVYAFALVSLTELSPRPGENLDAHYARGRDRAALLEERLKRLELEK